jgi:hypothetical protein
MRPVKLEDTNTWFGADQAGVVPCPATRWQQEDGKRVVSVGFELEPGELERLADGWPLVLDIMGEGMPPVRVRVTGGSDG